MPEYIDILGNTQEAMGVFMAEDRTYLDMSGKLREAEGVFITDTLLYDDLSGNAREAQGVFIVGGAGPTPFWEPFTVTAADLGGSIGFGEGEGGTITNEPVDGYTVIEAITRMDGDDPFFTLRISGPAPLRDSLVGAVFGINAQDYYPDYGEMQVSEDGGVWTTTIGIYNVPEWTVGQQIPIVIIPQNG